MVKINSRERLCPDRLADSMHARSCWRSNTCIGRVGCRLLLEFQVGTTPMFQHVRALDSWNPKVMYGMSNGEMSKMCRRLLAPGLTSSTGT